MPTGMSVGTPPFISVVKKITTTMGEIRQMLESADLNTLTPIEAMNLLFELQKKARG